MKVYAYKSGFWSRLWDDEFGWLSRCTWSEIFFGCIVCLPLLLMLFGLTLAMAWWGWEAARMAFKARDWQRRYAAGNTEAYHGAAVVDLELARQALQKGDVSRAEARASGARDKLDSPQAPAGSTPATRGLKALEEQESPRFRPIRLKRAKDRLGREGAETR
ncbi:MAG: hypothetical protein HY926_08885 [Elusimicrobia bacterium]|nr:hypothetical protein [Elusimicrobiota bacterium]